MTEKEARKMIADHLKNYHVNEYFAKTLLDRFGLPDVLELICCDIYDTIVASEQMQEVFNCDEKQAEELERIYKEILKESR
jgi:hypothetical protein